VLRLEVVVVVRIVAIVVIATDRRQQVIVVLIVVVFGAKAIIGGAHVFVVTVFAARFTTALGRSGACGRLSSPFSVARTTFATTTATSPSAAWFTFCFWPISGGRSATRVVRGPTFIENHVKFVQSVERRVVQFVREGSGLVASFAAFARGFAFARRLCVAVRTSAATAATTAATTLALWLASRGCVSFGVLGAFADDFVERQVDLFQEEFVDDRVVWSRIDFVRSATRRF
jgi:hypothetical protein